MVLFSLEQISFRVSLQNQDPCSQCLLLAWLVTLRDSSSSYSVPLNLLLAVQWESPEDHKVILSPGLSGTRVPSSVCCSPVLDHPQCCSVSAGGNGVCAGDRIPWCCQCQTEESVQRPPLGCVSNGAVTPPNWATPSEERKATGDQTANPTLPGQREAKWQENGLYDSQERGVFPWYRLFGLIKN